MKVMLARAWGDPSTLEYAEAPTPRPNAARSSSKSARSAATSDILIVQGKYQYKPELPFSPGCEVSGIVRGIGTGVTEVGLASACSRRWRGAATPGVVAVDQRHVYALPDFHDLRGGRGLRARVPDGLVRPRSSRRASPGRNPAGHAAAGGTGLAAVQARPRAGRSGHRDRGLGREARGRAGPTGPTSASDYRTEAWVERVTRETHGEGANVNLRSGRR